MRRLRVGRILWRLLGFRIGVLLGKLRIQRILFRSGWSWIVHIWSADRGDTHRPTAIMNASLEGR
jgi:hypothetical protein